jgi:hypothetical protein
MEIYSMKYYEDEFKKQNSLDEVFANGIPYVSLVVWGNKDDNNVVAKVKDENSINGNGTPMAKIEGHNLAELLLPGEGKGWPDLKNEAQTEDFKTYLSACERLKEHSLVIHFSGKTSPKILKSHWLNSWNDSSPAHNFSYYRDNSQYEMKSKEGETRLESVKRNLFEEILGLERFQQRHDRDNLKDWGKYQSFEKEYNALKAEVEAREKIVEEKLAAVQAEKSPKKSPAKNPISQLFAKLKSVEKDEK